MRDRSEVDKATITLRLRTPYSHAESHNPFALLLVRSLITTGSWGHKPSLYIFQMRHQEYILKQMVVQWHMEYVCRGTFLTNSKLGYVGRQIPGQITPITASSDADHQ